MFFDLRRRRAVMKISFDDRMSSYVHPPGDAGDHDLTQVMSDLAGAFG